MAQNDPAGTDRSPFNKWWLISLAFLLLVVVGLITALVLPKPQHAATATAKAEASAPTSSVPVPAGTGTPAGDGCALPAGSQAIPTTGPDAEWIPDGYVLIPTSTRFGPAANGTAWGCFAHSPTGALFAAANFIDGLSGPDYAAFARAAAVHNPALTAWVAGENPDAHAQTGGDVAQFSGFQFVKTSADAITVRVAAQQGAVTGAWTIALVWDDAARNWKADFASSDLTVAEVTNPAAFTSWSMTDDTAGGD